jgi:hypothetical protein
LVVIGIRLYFVQCLGHPVETVGVDLVGEAVEDPAALAARDAERLAGTIEPHAFRLTARNIHRDATKDCARNFNRGHYWFPFLD